jgi:hypothetical protein
MNMMPDLMAGNGSKDYSSDNDSARYLLTFQLSVFAASCSQKALYFLFARICFLHAPEQNPRLPSQGGFHSGRLMFLVLFHEVPILAFGYWEKCRANTCQVVPKMRIREPFRSQDWLA